MLTGMPRLHQSESFEPPMPCMPRYSARSIKISGPSPANSALQRLSGCLHSTPKRRPAASSQHQHHRATPLLPAPPNPISPSRRLLTPTSPQPLIARGSVQCTNTQLVFPSTSANLSVQELSPPTHFLWDRPRRCLLDGCFSEPLRQLPTDL